MKRILLPILVIGVLLLSACGAPTTAPEAEAPSTPSPPSTGVAWHQAQDHIGEKTTVCGPVVDTHWASGSKGKPTFLNIGRDYPDPDRFTVVIWIDCRANFPEPPERYYLGKTICVTGLIQEYEGVPQIEVCYPSKIQEQ